MLLRNIVKHFYTTNQTCEHLLDGVHHIAGSCGQLTRFPGVFAEKNPHQIDQHLSAVLDHIGQHVFGDALF